MLPVEPRQDPLNNEEYPPVLAECSLNRSPGANRPAKIEPAGPQRRTMTTDILQGSMLHRDSPFRLLVTVLLAVAVPFCCCNFHSWFSGCIPCQAPASDRQGERLAHVHADGSSHDHSSHHEHQDGPASNNGDDHAPKPCAPGNDKHDCDCGKNSGMMLTVQKSSVELPAPVVVAVLDWALPADVLPTALFRGLDRERRVVERPQTSLLRLHCALIV